MKKIKLIFRNLISFFISFYLIIVFLLSLFLLVSIQVSLVINIMMILFSFGLFCFCIYKFVYAKRSFHLLYFKGLSGLLSFTFLTITTFFVLIFFFSINLMISNEPSKNLTLEEKFNLYMILFRENQTSQTNYNAIKENKLVQSYLNVEIYYEPDERDLLPIIKQNLDTADSITTSLFGSVKDNEIDLILHPSTEELYESTKLFETMGYFDDPNDTLGVAISDLEEIVTDRMPGTFYFQSTLMHEYTHYRLQAFIKEQGLFVYKVPLWFHEGVAEFVGMYNVTQRYYPFRETSFTKLVTHDDWEKYRLKDYDVYLQSLYAIQYIVNQYGETMIKSIIEETAKANDFNEGFTRATGITIDDLQALYLVEAKQTGDET
ncbi:MULTISPECIES: hypothetical protein [Metabacillus]|uniref:Peptidase MA-like domain-containing protein n=1 Tax=Metabacillus rhizolycopersici TaxID=2875709 RepID=A0ABS7UW96_9BACI|nr:MULTISPECIES: hypothetical protein [Metabacillus]MBZ5752588.1 hypothetical protein [Metabacillus rhizolycopersici]MCM3651796.1 hypothetical protein [Metabacillus litoralis]